MQKLGTEVFQFISNLKVFREKNVVCLLFARKLGNILSSMQN